MRADSYEPAVFKQKTGIGRESREYNVEINLQKIGDFYGENGQGFL